MSKSYKILQEVGRGSQSVVVYKVQKKSKIKQEVSIYAVKVIPKFALVNPIQKLQVKNEVQVQRIMRECETTSKLVRVYETETEIKILL